MTQQQTFMLIAAVFVVAFLIIKSNKSSGTERAPVPVNLMDPNAWEIGPADYPSGNPSAGVPLRPAPHPDGWAIDIPSPSWEVGHVHYVTVPTGPLTGKSKVTMRFRIEAAPDARLVPVHFPAAHGLICLYLQREGDRYTRETEAYRWWASFAMLHDPRAGEHVLEARFDQNWTAVLSSSHANNPDLFQAALDNAARIGFTLGGGDGLGHGVYATGPARLVVTSFEVL